MNTPMILRNVGRFLILMLLQILVLNNVYLGGYINPFIYVLFILMLPTGMNRLLMLVLAFCSGLLVDVFSNMLGFHAFACTFVAFARITFADRILTRDDPVVIETPSVFTVSPQSYIGFMLLLLFIYNVIYFTMVVFEWQDWWRILVLAVLSTLVSGVMCLLYQLVFIRGIDKGNT